ncbi:hypothetical protein EJD97_008633 [Solanum chilense]|uniref:Fe2OG dioxygenase domain-containing protein n=1 Tax=Solanum chilense TaxID=4083 RepID=A0A6N2BS92_SOLCI|nr:hypothetical protein EJD97_008633 [Solanum chilense]
MHSIKMSISKVEQSYDRMSESKVFDDTKAGVKRLVDFGITKVPQIFILPPNIRAEKCETKFTFPVIDLQGIDEDPIKHKDIVDKVRDASDTWGFFQVVNHGIPISVLNKTLQGTRQFFDQDNEVKKQYYTRDIGRKVFCNSNIDLYRPSVPIASRKDTFFCFITPNPPSPQEFPTPCCYSCNYYPPCPQPELTMGSIQHTDVDFVTVLLQDDIGGLQVLHQNHWVDVPPTPGALVVNLGDFLKVSTHIHY